MILRLNPFLTKVTLCFNDPPAPAGGEGAGPAANNEGGGGGGPGGDAEINEFADFTPPDIDFAALGEKKSGGDPAPKAGEKPAEPATPKPGEKPVPAAPVVKDPPAALLRKELETSKAALAAAEKRLQEGDPRLKQYQDDVKAARAELEAERKKSTEYEQKLAVMDPRVTAKVAELDSAHDAVLGKFFLRVPEMDQSSLTALTRQYYQLPFGKEGYPEALRAFEAAVNKQLGGDEITEHKRLPQALEMIEKTFDFLNQRRELEGEIRKNALSLRAAADEQEFGKTKGFISEKLQFAQSVPEELEKTQPFHPKVVLKHVLGAMTPEQKAQTVKGIPEFIELAMGGVKPMGDADFAGLTKEQIAEARELDTAKREHARGGAIDMIYNGAIALRTIPSLWKEIERLNTALSARAAADPDDPTRGAEGGGGGDSSDIRDFKAPPVLNRF